MADFQGLITDPDINRRFIEAVRAFVPARSPFQIYENPEWPELTVGVVDGKPCMSADLHKQASFCEVKPEDN